MVNAADALTVKRGSRQVDDDVLDEEAEREAFKQAVLEWRHSNSDAAPKKISIVREWESAKPEDGANPKAVKANENLWHNPFAPMSDDDNFDLDRASKASANSSSATGQQQAGIGTLGEGELDEEAEHAVRLS
jgi:hypothetical protein